MTASATAPFDARDLDLDAVVAQIDERGYCVVENGGTGVVPFSHRFGRTPEAPTDCWRDDGVVLEGKAGSVALGHGAWYHSARPNTTDEYRCCLLGMYLKPCIIPQEDMHAQLEKIEAPSDLVRQLMGGNQHRPRSVGG